MNGAPQSSWTTERFLARAATQDCRLEFDGFRPVAMTGGTARHSRISANILAALRARLRGSASYLFGPGLGVLTGNGTVRYPDALITCTPFPDTDVVAPDPVVVFEVLSPGSGRADRIDEVREYASVASIRRYVIVETTDAGVLVLHRPAAGQPWTATALTPTTRSICRKSRSPFQSAACTRTYPTRTPVRSPAVRPGRVPWSASRSGRPT